MWKRYYQLTCISLFLALLFPACLFAQRVYHMNVDNGLCTNSLTDLTLDHNGNMWIGSYSGLMKFSGTHIKCINKVGKDPDEISGPEMHSVSEDNCGFIWIGTTAGLNKINPVTFEVQQYPIKSPYAGSTSVGYIYSVHADKYDFVWFSTDIALFRMDINTGIYEAIPTQQDEKSVPDYSVLYNGYIETDDGLWISTTRGMAFFEFKTQKFFHRYHNPHNKSIFNIQVKSRDSHSDLEQDSSGRIWFVSENKYLARYDITSNQLDSFKLPIPKGTWLCCWSIAVDARENIWIGTRHGGIIVFDIHTKTFKSLKDDGINRLIQSDYIYSIEKGPQGQMFVAHDHGLDIIDLYDLSLKESKISSRVDLLNLKYESGEISFDETGEAVFIPFYNFGFFKYDLQTDTISVFKTPLLNRYSTPFVYEKDDKLFLSLNGNLELVNTSEDGISATDNKLLPDTITSPRGHVIWLHEESPQSIYVRKSSGEVFHIHNDTIDVRQGFGFKPNICISPDSQIISYINQDLNLVRHHLFSRKDDTIDLQLRLQNTDFSFANPRHIVDDGTSVWMTGQNGVLRFDYLADKLISYGVEEGLSHSFTFSIVLDPDLNVWVGNIGGIDRFDKVQNRFVSMHKMYDNTYMDAFGNAICSENGNMFFHFGNKIMRLRLEGLDKNSTGNIPLQINEVRINGQNIDWQDQKRLQHLHYSENRVTLIYDLLFYEDPELVSFEYRINGKDWIDNGRRNEINLDGLSNGKYLLEVRSSVETNPNAARELSLAFRIQPPWWKQWWFIAFVMLLFSGSIWIYFRGRIDKYRKELFVTRQIMDLESKALRAQMNPHFVFNSLNAIQECIVTGKVDEAYTYLSKFSRLLRIVLEHSDRPEVTLQEELEVLDLYISLEKLRFKNDMQYQFEIEEELDSEEILIPPMLIQPHIENAIWHGLRHKEGEKYLRLAISEKQTGYLEVIIEDNGIGRKKSGEIRQERLGGNKHNSKGTILSENRMDILQKTFPSTSMVINDLYNPQGIATGTKVVLSIPILNNRIKIKNE